jgi:hypothetical protein
MSGSPEGPSSSAGTEGASGNDATAATEKWLAEREAELAQEQQPQPAAGLPRYTNLERERELFLAAVSRKAEDDNEKKEKKRQQKKKKKKRQQQKKKKRQQRKKKK